MPVSSITSLDLLILGLLQDRPMHGYELHQQIKSEEIDAWFDLSMAGIYYSLAKLRDRGLVAESRQHRAGSAKKAIYYVTDAGRAAFFEAMEAQVADEQETHFAYDLGIYLLNRLPIQNALALLERRRAFLVAWAARVHERQFAPRPLPLPAHARAILDHTARFIEMERQWLEEVIQSILAAPSVEMNQPSAGLMTLAGDLRQYHLPDLVRLIAAGQHSGSLTVTDGSIRRCITFEAGQPVCFACSDAPIDSSPETVTDFILDLFCWNQGEFRFEQSSVPPECRVPAHITTEELILRGCRRADRWEIIQRLVPSADTIYERDMPIERTANLGLLPEETEILQAINGACTVADIAQSLKMTIFDISKSIYGLAAIGAVRVADAERTRVRRLFREIAELMCRSTLTWRRSPNDLTCEREVNAQCDALPLRIVEGRISDQSDPNLRTNELVKLYSTFLRAQLGVVSRRFGFENAHQAYQRTIKQLVPELQDVARRWGFDKLAEA